MMRIGSRRRLLGFESVGSIQTSDLLSRAGRTELVVIGMTSSDAARV